jgi:hypothetical protein
MEEVEVVEVDREKKRVEIRILNVFYTFVLSPDGKVLLESRGSHERDQKSGVNVTLFKRAFYQASAILAETRAKEKFMEKQGKLF